MKKRENQKTLATDFAVTLLTRYPELSPAELRVCAYLRMNMSSMEIARITNRSVRTIEYTRTNIRKKMSLNRDENLIKHLITIDCLELQ